MPRDTPEGRGRWKASKSVKPAQGRKQAKKWTAIGILGTLLTGSALGALYLLLVFSGWLRPRPHYVPFWVGRYEQPRIAPVSWMDADRKAIQEGNYFRDFEDSDFNDPNLEVMITGLDALGKKKASDSVVAHFSGYAILSSGEEESSGPIRILAKDSNPMDPGTLLPLRTVLRQFAACPSRKKLLILDIMKPRLDPYDLGGMGTSDGVSDLVRDEIDLIAGANAGVGGKNAGLVLIACAEGQSSVEIESLGGSLFDYHLRSGLEDPAADRNGDGRITAKELAGYVGKMVNRDANRYRGLHQNPRLLGRGEDFAIVSVGARRPEKAKPKPTENGKEAEKDKAETPAEKEKKDEPSKGSEKPPEKGKKAEVGKEGTAAGTQQGRSYPTWLADGWAARQRLWGSGEDVDTPRPFRTLEAHLIRAEQRWRGGDDPARLQEETARLLQDLDGEMKKARDTAWLTPRSVGQARSIGWKPDDAIVTDLKATLRLRREPDGFAKPEQRAETLNASAKAFVAKLKGKTTLDLAGAMVDALASADERIDADTLKFADSIVGQALKADTSLRLDLIELRFLGVLARRAESPGAEPWPEPTARKAWDVVVQAEQADCRPRSLAWIRGLLDRADSLRHVAEQMTLPATAGYSSWNQIDAAWEQARLAYEFVVNAQAKIDNAHATLARSRAFLPAYIPFLEMSHQPEYERTWVEASVATRALAGLLKLPSSSTGATPAADPTREAIEQLTGDLGEATRSLADMLAELRRPFSARTLAELIAACRSERDEPDSRLALRIESLLSVPFSSSDERRELWTACRDLDLRLSKKPATDQPEATDTSAEIRLRENFRANRVNARATRLAALVRLAGDDKTADDMDATLRRTIATPDANSAPAIWRLLANRCANVRKVLKNLLDQKGPDEGLADWVSPVDDLDWLAHPVPDVRRRRILAVLGWLARRYRHEKEDARDPESVSFFRQAELDIFNAIEAQPEAYPELAAEPTAESTKLKLSVDRTRDEFPFRIILRAPADSGPRKISLSVVKPEDDRLRITLVGDTELNLDPQAVRTAKARVEWVDDGIRVAGRPGAPAGFIIQARMGSSDTYHLPVPLSIVAGSEQLQLALSSAPDRLVDIPFDLRLRVIPDRQKFFVYVRNPSATPRNLVVEVLEGESVVAGTEAKLTVAASSTEKVKAFGAAPIPPKEALHEPAGPLQLRLKDAASGEVYQIQKLPVDLASPRDYVDVHSARFTPPQPGEPNRLEVKFRALASMTTPPCSLAMTLDKRWIPALVGVPKELKLSGSLEPQGSMTLYAGGLTLNPVETSAGLFPVDVDGLQRAFWFRTRFEQSGGPQIAEVYRKPRVTFEATQIFKPNEVAKLKVSFQVDDAPAGARLKWQLGQLVDGKLENDITPFEVPAKERRIGFDARGADGALLFEATSRDWDHEFSIPNIRGLRRLQAKLIDADGRTELGIYAIDRGLDDQPPSDIALLVPAEIAKAKKRLTASASLPPPASGVKEVSFYYGKGNPADFEKARAANQVFKGKQARADDPRGWQTDLTIPSTASGSLVVSVRVESKVGLAGFATAEVGVVEPKPTPDPDEEAAAKAAMPKFGEIAGKVTEGDRPQPDLTVYVYPKTPKAGAEAKVSAAKSAKDGSFSFKELDPGTYIVQSANPASATNARAEATVEAGKTAAANLDLVR